MGIYGRSYRSSVGYPRSYIFISCVGPMINEIADKVQRIIGKSTEISESEVVHLLTLCGKAIERDTLEDKYQVLKFFRDWAQHTNIEWSKPGLDMLLELQKTIVVVDGLHDHDAMLRTISSVLSLEQLRSELKRMLVHLSVSSKILDSDGWWRKFIIHLVSILKDCPIQFPKQLNSNAKYARDIYKQIMDIPLFGKQDGVVGLSVKMLDGNIYNRPELANRQVPNLAIKLKSTTTIMSPLTLGKQHLAV